METKLKTQTLEDVLASLKRGDVFRTNDINSFNLLIEYVKNYEKELKLSIDFDPEFKYLFVITKKK